jgi:hypothetical protein
MFVFLLTVDCLCRDGATRTEANEIMAHVAGNRSLTGNPFCTFDRGSQRGEQRSMHEALYRQHDDMTEWRMARFV